MIKFQQSQAVTSHFESFWSIVYRESLFQFTFPVIATKSTYQRPTYKCTSIITERTTPFNVKAFWGSVVARIAPLTIALFGGKKRRISIAIDRVVNSLSRTKLIWKSTKIFIWKTNNWTKTDLRNLWNRILADLITAVSTRPSITFTVSEIIGKYTFRHSVEN